MTISELRKSLEKTNHDVERYSRKIKELTEENERLRVSLRNTTESYEFVNGIVLESRADTVRKMQERLKAKVRLPDVNEAYSLSPYSMRELIDKIAKEMMEGL